MKYIKRIFCFVILLANLTTTLCAQIREKSDKDYIPQQRQLEQQYRSELERLVLHFTAKASQYFSPMSGREFRGELLSEQGIGYSREDGFISCRAKLLWQARDYWSGVPYDWCEVSGIIRYYPPLRSIDKPIGIFTPERVNKQVVAVSDSTRVNTFLNKNIQVELDIIR